MSEEFLGETFEEQESREKIEFFFGQYSAGVRKGLLSKNVAKPQNIYDILYVKTREVMLAKNENTFSVNLDEKAKEVRNTMLSKHVEKQINLDLSGDNIRQSQLSKNNLLQTSVDLNKLSDSVRNNLLSKNTSAEVDLENRATQTREINIAHNTNKNINLDQKADEVRANLLSKNNDHNVDLDTKASSARANMLSSNIQKEINLDNAASQTRATALSKNNDTNINLDKEATKTRENQESKNIDKNINLDSSAETVRGTMLSSNKKDARDLDSIAQGYRTTNESANVDKPLDIDKLSDATRSKMISGNVDTENPIENIANKARNNQESSNSDKVINLDDAASKVRSNMLSSNDDKETDLDKVAEKTRNSMLSSNKIDTTNLDDVASKIRTKSISNNKETNIDLDKNSESVRGILLSSNKETNIDLDKNSESVRGNLLSSNTPNNIDLDKSAEKPRKNLLANNVPDNIDLDKSSETPRNNSLSKNVSDSIDLDKSAETPRNNSLSKNVPDSIDLDKISEASRHLELSKNVSDSIDLDKSANASRTAMISANVPDNIDLDQSAIKPRNQLLSANDGKVINLDQSSLITRNNILSSNVKNNVDLDQNAEQARNASLAANVQKPNTIEDIASVFRHDLLSKNDAPANRLGTTVFLAGTSTFIGVSDLDVISAPIRTIMKSRGTIFDNNTDLQPVYGFALSGSGVPVASITSAAQLYNVQKNAFMNVRFDDRSSGYNLLLNHNSDGFQQLLSFSQISSLRETETNTTPANVIVQNKGVYVGLPSNSDNSSSVTKLLKPTDGILGTAASMMASTVPGDMIAVNFNKNERGVVRIINTIKKDSSIAMAKNYDVQNNSSFIVGTNSDGTNRLASSRYTVANPYQPNADAGTLELRIKNYAIYNSNPTLIHTMSFPPYIKSFQNSDGASWNKMDFLGRPEPIYTYSNSSREGSLSFFILTDYSQSVDVGFDYSKLAPTPNPLADSKHFTSQVDGGGKNSDISVEISNKQKQIADLQQQLTVAQQNNVGNTANIQAQISELNSQITSLSEQQINLSEGGVANKLGPNRKYSEFDDINGNVYKTLINNGTPIINGSIDTQTEQTVNRLTRMKKDLLFQPAFFSGDKVDFLNRMEFMSKLTRPSRNASNRGFSFTFPPVCHIHLGDFLNHDVIINNVSYDYADAPWSIDGSGGRVQPMWALVTLSFNIVGTYGGKAGQDVPLADDIGGFYQTKIR